MPDQKFKLRIGEANAATRTPIGAKYQQTLSAPVGKAIQICLPPGTISQNTLGKFILVANITPSGTITSPDVEPKTDLSQCFEAQFSQQHLATPPIPPDSKFDYPIVVELNITP